MAWGDVGDEAEVGFVILVERGRDADDDGVHLIHAGVVEYGGKSLRVGGLNFFRADAVNVGFGPWRGYRLCADRCRSR